MRNYKSSYKCEGIYFCLAGILRYKFNEFRIKLGEEFSTGISYGYFILKSMGERFAIVSAHYYSVDIVYSSNTKFFITDETGEGLYIYRGEDGLRFKNQGSGPTHEVQCWAFT